MSWSQWHKRSEAFASNAHAALLRGEHDIAADLLRKAGEAEQKALEILDSSKEKTIGITLVSAVSLFYKAREFEQAEQLAARWIGTGALPDFAVEQLRSLMQACWNELAKLDMGLDFATGQILVSVKGGEIGFGAAPLDLILEKAQTVKAFLTRTIEFVNGVTHRRRGNPSDDIQEAYRPWLLQAPAGSYQFAVTLEAPRQMSLLAPKASVDEVSCAFIDIVKAASEDPDGELVRVVPQDEYRNTFLKLTRNLSPTGAQFQQTVFTIGEDATPVVLVPETRDIINASLKKANARKNQGSRSQPGQLRGTLRAVHLDNDWLAVQCEDGLIQVRGLQDAIDDVIGPMVNKKVVVHTLKMGRGLRFVDIEPEQ